MKFTKSIRWRLLLWIALFLALILGGLDLAASQIHRANRLAEVDETLRRRVAAMSTAMFAPSGPLPGSGAELSDSFDPPEPPPDNRTEPPPRNDLVQRFRPPAPGPAHEPQRPMPDDKMIGVIAASFDSANTNGFYFVIWRRALAAPYKASANVPSRVPRPQVAGGDTGTYNRTRDGYREMYHTTEGGDCILAGRTLAPEAADARRFAGLTILGSFAVMAFGLGGAWLIIGRALQPVEKISAAARRIANGDLSERINADETDSELGQLAGVLNSTFVRLEASFAQQKQFTADAAHELRTPLAVMISEAQTTLARERGVADYRDALSVCLETAQQMRRLTESLLELARFDGGQENLRREKLNVSAVIADCVKLTAPLAARRSVKINCHLTPAEVFGDAVRLAQVATNLLTNAIYFSREGGEVGVVACVENGLAVVRVSDSGCGISAVDLPRIFERFYRADRSRGGSHAGLGLAIAKCVVEAHGGKIEAASAKDSGAIFTVRLPLAT